MKAGAVAESSHAIKQTKEEQENLLAKMAAYQEKKEYSAAGIDFSKPVDQQEANEEAYDPKKEVTNFQTFCDLCGQEGLCKMCCATIPYFSEIPCIRVPPHQF